MDRRRFVKASAAVGLAAAMPASLRAATAQRGASGRGRPPNVVLIMADDLGYECIGANGGESYATPVLDKLAKTGLRFEHCYSQPLCTPSRVQIMTGQYNVRNYTRFGKLERGQTTFAHLLKAKGYATCVAGKWQLGREPDSPQHFGFDESCLWQQSRKRTNKGGRDTRYENPVLDVNGKTVDYTNGEYGPDVVCDYACEFMERHRDRPFLAYYPMILMHCPFVPTPDSPDWDPTSGGSKSYKGDAKYFGDMVTYMDKLVGRIVAKLEALGLRENTLVLFTGDNGTDKPVVSELGGRKVAGAKGAMTDGGTRVPLIANWPAACPGGRVTDDLVDFSDFVPTLCGATGATVPASLPIDGRSFLPQLRGERGDPRRWVYCWYSRGGGPSAEEWARNQRYKLYRGGAFYDVAEDPLEKEALTDPTPEALRARALLHSALDRYADARRSGLKK